MKGKAPGWLLIVLALAGAWLLLGGKLPSFVGGGGASHFIVLHDGTNDDARFGELTQELQDSSSPVAKEISAAGWWVQVLDDDNTTGDDQPHPTLKALGLFGTIQDSRRELVAFVPPAKIVSREPLPPDATAESVLTMIRAKGKR